MPFKVIEDFISNYLGAICPLLDPLEITHSEKFIKFRSDIVIEEISEEMNKKSNEMTEFYFHFVPSNPTNFTYSNIEECIKEIFLNDRIIKELLRDLEIVVDFYYRKLDEYTFPSIVVKFFIIGKIVDLDFFSLIYSRICEVNKIIPTDNLKIRGRDTDQLYSLLSTRNTEPFDFFSFRNYFFFNGMKFPDLHNLNLLNFFVPKILTINDLEIQGDSVLFSDIRG